MNDLVRKQDVIYALVEKGQSSKRYKFGDFWELNLLEIKEAVDAMPSVESERKGKWQRRKDSDCWECSQCHAVLENEDLGMHNFYFCYHCGANMMNEDGYMNLEKGE